MDASVAAGGGREALLAFVRPWLHAPRGGARLAAILADVDGWVAVVRDVRGRERVIVGRNGTILEDDAVLLDVLERVARGTAAIPSAKHACLARRRIRQWLRADGAADLIRTHGGDDGSSRATIARRLDAALRAAPLNQRAALQSRIIAVLARTAGMHGAGCERALAAASKRSTTSELLDAVEAIGEPPEDKRPAARGSRLLALLLLVTDERDSATDRPPNPCSPHATACSGTAAPR